MENFLSYDALKAFEVFISSIRRMMVPYFVDEHQIRSTMTHLLLDMMIITKIENQNCLYVQLKHCETLLSTSSSSSSTTTNDISRKLARSITFIKKSKFSVT